MINNIRRLHVRLVPFGYGLHPLLQGSRTPEEFETNLWKLYYRLEGAHQDWEHEEDEEEGWDDENGEWEDEEASAIHDRLEGSFSFSEWKAAVLEHESVPRVAKKFVVCLL